MKNKHLLLSTLMLTAGCSGSLFAQTKIGGAVGPSDSSALLHLGDATGNNKGLLMPRVALTATTTWGLAGTTSRSGMQVYNTATSGTGTTKVTPGIYYWDTNRWVRLQATYESIVGSGVPPAGSCTPATIYTDTLAGSATEGQQWTCDGSGWVTTPTSTAWYLSGTTTDAGGNKTAAMGRTGAVGIGTTTPAARLHVSGSGGVIFDDVSGLTPVVRTNAAAGAAVSKYTIYDAPNSAGIPGAVLSGFISNSGTAISGANFNGGIFLTAEEIQSATNKGSALNFYTHPLGSGPQMQVMRINEDGKVGIGTTAPSTRLDVYNGSAGAIKIVDGTQGANKVLTSDANGVGTWQVPATAPAEPWFNVATNTGATANTQNVYQMGNVGIGTAAPAAKLHVVNANDVIFENTSDVKEIIRTTAAAGVGVSKYTVYDAPNSSGTSGAVLGGFISNSGTAVSGANFNGGIFLTAEETQSSIKKGSALNFYTHPMGAGPQMQVMRINELGNVGIGTTLPATRLDVYNGTTAGAIKIVDGTQGLNKVLTSDANGVGTWQASAVKAVQGVFGPATVTTNTSPQYINLYIDLPAGTWAVNLGLLLTNQSGTHQWAGFQLSSSTTSVTTTGFAYVNTSLAGHAYRGHIAANNLSPAQNPGFAMISGSQLITCATATRIYIMLDDATTPIEYNNTSFENYLYALRLN